MIDHRSYTHNISSFEIKAWKKKSRSIDLFILRIFRICFGIFYCVILKKNKDFIIIIIIIIIIIFIIIIIIIITVVQYSSRIIYF